MTTLTILSGGTATNELVPILRDVADHVCYVLPISDNGGSTSELIRFLGGPAIGDIRSRLTRLIESDSLRNLLSFRLSSDPETAKSQWNRIVEGTHELWQPIGSCTKEIFRAFLIHVNVELLKRSKSYNAQRQFRYELANIGNLFLTGLRMFIGSLDSAIETFMKLTDIRGVSVLPCINTNFTYHISALLQNGLIITGQSQISHPSEEIHSRNNNQNDNQKNNQKNNQNEKEMQPGTNEHKLNEHNQNEKEMQPTNEHKLNEHNQNEKEMQPTNEHKPLFHEHDVSHLHEIRLDLQNKILNDCVSPLLDVYPPPIHPTRSPTPEVSSDEETGNVPLYTHPELKKSQLHFNKSDNIPPLLSPIERIFYVSPYGQEICPTADARVVSSIASSTALVYSVGSLMTSIVPIIILKGVGKAIASGPRKKILLLNGCHDRETFGMDAADFIRVIVDSAKYSIKQTGRPLEVSYSDFVTHLVYMEDPKIKVDTKVLGEMGITCVRVKREVGPDYYDMDDLRGVLRNINRASPSITEHQPSINRA